MALFLAMMISASERNVMTGWDYVVGIGGAARAELWEVARDQFNRRIVQLDDVATTMGRGTAIPMILTRVWLVAPGVWQIRRSVQKDSRRFTRQRSRRHCNPPESRRTLTPLRFSSGRLQCLNSRARLQQSYSTHSPCLILPSMPARRAPQNPRCFRWSPSPPRLGSRPALYQGR